MKTTNPDEIQKELACSRETALEVSFWRSLENRKLTAEWKKNLPAIRARCAAAYEAALADYTARHPHGKNGHKSALRKAREIWSGYDFHH